MTDVQQEKTARQHGNRGGPVTAGKAPHRRRDEQDRLGRAVVHTVAIRGVGDAGAATPKTRAGGQGDRQRKPGRHRRVSRVAATGQHFLADQRRARFVGYDLAEETRDVASLPRRGPAAEHRPFGGIEQGAAAQQHPERDRGQDAEPTPIPEMCCPRVR